jgi:hypothetical protein
MHAFRARWTPKSLQRGSVAAVAVVAVVALVALAASPSGAAGPYPDLGSCQVFPDPPAGTSPTAKSLPTQAAWNQDISQAPRAKNSAKIISYINGHGGSAFHPDFGTPSVYGFPYSVVDAGQPQLAINYTAYGSESSPGPFPIPANAPIEGGSGSSGDRHVLTVDRSQCKLYEIYRSFYKPSPQPHWNTEGGVAWDLNSDATWHDDWTSADAAGLPIFPGLVRYDEVAAGHLEHAIRLTVESTRNAYIHPATHCAGDTDSGAAPPMGLRLRLKPGFGLGGFSGASKVIAEAMKRYGLIVADNGSNWYISGSSDSRWDDNNLNQLKRIPGSAFEVVASAAGVRSC